MSVSNGELRLEQIESGWVLAGEGAAGFGLVNDYLSYLVDRNYSPRTIRSYGYSLLAFCRWMTGDGIELSSVSTDVLLRFLAACRIERVTGRRGGSNVVDLAGRRTDSLSPATVNQIGRAHV